MNEAGSELVAYWTFFTSAWGRSQSNLCGVNLGSLFEWEHYLVSDYYSLLPLNVGLFVSDFDPVQIFLYLVTLHKELHSLYLYNKSSFFGFLFSSRFPPLLSNVLLVHCWLLCMWFFSQLTRISENWSCVYCLKLFSPSMLIAHYLIKYF